MLNLVFLHASLQTGHKNPKEFVMKKWMLLTPVLALLLITSCANREEEEYMETADTVSTNDSGMYNETASVDKERMRQEEQSEWMEKRTDDASVQVDKKTFTDSKVVEKVQQELNDRGYSAGPTDGIIGPNTSQALTRFQRHEGLDTTGRINRNTLRALNLEDMAMEATEEFAE